jgi:hypothetical protein
MKKLAVTVLFTALFAVASVTPANACQMSGKNGMSAQQCAKSGMDQKSCMKSDKVEKDATSHHKNKSSEIPSKDTRKDSVKS